MDKVIDKIASLNIRYRLNNNRICVKCYTDEDKIIAESEEELQTTHYISLQHVNINS